MGGGQLLYAREWGVDDGCGGEIPVDMYTVILGPRPSRAACDGEEGGQVRDENGEGVVPQPVATLNGQVFHVDERLVVAALESAHRVEAHPC